MGWRRSSGVACAVAALASGRSAAEPAPPAPLACLAKHYSLVPEQTEKGAWLGRLPDGSTVPYGPDLIDMYEIRYPKGPVAPVLQPDFDPGRVRYEPMFAATFGDPPSPDDLPTVWFFGTRVRVHRRVVPALGRVVQKLNDAVRADLSLTKFLEHAGGGYARRHVAASTRMSPHAYGIAIDIGTERADYWLWTPQRTRKWRSRIPEAIVQAFESEGFIWGGRWYHYDTMHFEYRPELLDDACYP
jgi:hypothetical protein